MYLSLFGNKEKLRIGLASVNGSSEGAGVRMLKRAASEVENQPALELPNASANSFVRRAHHRRCAREGLTVRHYALIIVELQGEDGKFDRARAAPHGITHGADAPS